MFRACCGTQVRLVGQHRLLVYFFHIAATDFGSANSLLGPQRNVNGFDAHAPWNGIFCAAGPGRCPARVALPSGAHAWCLCAEMSPDLLYCLQTRPETHALRRDGVGGNGLNGKRAEKAPCV